MATESVAAGSNSDVMAQVDTLQGDVVVLRASGEKALLSTRDNIFDGDTVISPECGFVQLAVSAAEIMGFVSIHSLQMAKIDVALLENNAWLLEQTSAETPIAIGTPVDAQVWSYVVGEVPADTDVIVAAPFATMTTPYVDADDSFIWRDNNTAPAEVDHIAEGTITFQLADITGIGRSENASELAPEFTQSSGTLKLGDLITGSVSSALEAASYVHVTTTDTGGVSGLYIDREGNITDQSRAALNESLHIYGDSVSVESVADQIQALMDMGFIEL